MATLSAYRTGLTADEVRREEWVTGEVWYVIGFGANYLALSPDEARVVHARLTELLAEGAEPKAEG